MYANIATLICGGLGGYLFTFDRTIPYFAGIIFQIMGFYIILNIPNADVSTTTSGPDLNRFVRDSIIKLRSVDYRLAIPVFLVFTIQLTIQPLFHYWQPLFYELDPNISGKTLGAVFISYTLCAIVMNYVFSRITTNKYFRSIECIFSMILISTIFYFVTSSTDSMIVSLISFTFLQGILLTSLTSISANMNRFIDGENRPVVLKLISFFSRIGMLISFGCIQMCSFLTVHDLYFFSGCILFIGIVVGKIVHLKFLKINLVNGGNLGNAT